jgi:hypothetical protein
LARRKNIADNPLRYAIICVFENDWRYQIDSEGRAMSVKTAVALMRVSEWSCWNIEAPFSCTSPINASTVQAGNKHLGA